MVDIAQNYSGKPVSLKDIAKRQEISELYLEQIFSILKKVKLVKSVKGSYGGYLLTNHPSEISVKSVLEALEGDISLTDDRGKNESEIQTFLYETLFREIDKKGQEISLNELLKEEGISRDEL